MSEPMPTHTRVNALVLHVLGAGAALWYLACLSNDGWSLFHNAFAMDAAYNYYFLALLDGRFDVPLRTIAYEGHFLPDGRAFVYYGLAPALLRAFVAPFVDLTRIAAAPAIVWALAAATGFICQSALLYVVRRARLTNRYLELFVLVAGSFAIWFSSPLTALAGSAPIYHEPILVAFLLAVLFLRLALPLAYGDRTTPSRLVALATVAALAVHARPHVAAALYLVTCGLIALRLWSIRRESGETRFRAFTRQGGLACVAAVTVLALSGLLYLGVNKARFGDSFTYHGSSNGPVVQGSVFLGMERADSRRWRGFSEQGRFNVRRIIPNASYYLLADKALHGRLSAWFETGFIRLEPPMRSVAALWAPWLVVVLAGGVALIRSRRPPQPAKALADKAPALLLLGASGLVLVTMLSYATITLRYTTELFIFVFYAATLSLGLLLASLDRIGRVRGAALLSLATAALVLSLAVFGKLGVEYRKKFRDDDHFFFSYEFCAKALTRHHLPPQSIKEKCQMQHLLAPQ